MTLLSNVESTMIPLTNIHSLTDFRHNARKFVDALQESHTPLVLTVNGKAAIVVEDVASFEACQNRIRELENEVKALKLGALQEALAIGAEQAEQGKFSKRSFDDIIAAAKAAVTEETTS